MTNDHLPKKISQYFKAIIFFAKKELEIKMKISAVVSRPTLNLNYPK